MSVVLFTGRKQAGKNTAAQVLIDEMGYRELSFAADIKQIIIDLDPVIASHMPFRAEDGYMSVAMGDFRVSDFLKRGHTVDTLKESNEEFRRLLQFLGTEVMRKRDSEFWVKQVTQQIEADPEANWVITDGRFHNEVAKVKSLDDAIVIFVQNDVAEAAPVKHESEAYAGKLGEDYTIHNNYSIEELRAQVLDIMSAKGTGNTGYETR